MDDDQPIEAGIRGKVFEPLGLPKIYRSLPLPVAESSFRVILYINFPENMSNSTYRVSPDRHRIRAPGGI